MTGEETGRGESRGWWELEEGGTGGITERRSKRIDGITSLSGYTVAYNRRRG